MISTLLARRLTFEPSTTVARYPNAVHIVDELMKDVDLDGGGEISFRELMVLLRKSEPALDFYFAGQWNPLIVLSDSIIGPGVGILREGLFLALVLLVEPSVCSMPPSNTSRSESLLVMQQSTPSGARAMVLRTN